MAEGSDGIHETDPEAVGPGRVGPYRLVRLLGRGGFGEVFLGVDDDGQQAAVKVLHAHHTSDPAMRRRFSEELSQARKVSGFCVAPILDADADADQPWIATEFVDGPTLSAAVTEEGPRTGDALHRLAVSTATALAAIHASGVVHRDLKPDNIMLAADGPRVIDFGIARGLEATAVTASGVVGTVGYMAPEQLEGARLGPPVDVFAWGASMVFAGTGREAFPGPTQAARITRVLTGAPDIGDLEDPLASTVRAALEKDPARRPDASQLLTLLVAPTRSVPQTAVLSPAPTTDHAQGPMPSIAPTKVEGPGVVPPREIPFTADPTPPSPNSIYPVVSRAALDGHTNHRDTSDVPPFHFNGMRFTDPRSLAAEMQRDWRAAARLFGSAEELATLGAWLMDDLRDTTVDRSLFRRRPDEINLAVASFIAQANPQLPPVFRGHDASVAGLAQLFSNPDRVATGDRSAGELLLLARPQVLRTLAMHEGQDDLRRLTEQLREAEEAAEQFLTLMAENLAGWRNQRRAVNTAMVLTYLLHPELITKPSFNDPNAQEWSDVLWRSVESAGGERAAGRAAAIWATTDVVASLGDQRRQWELRLHDAKQELEAAERSVWLWRWLHPIRIVSIIAGILLVVWGGALDLFGILALFPWQPFLLGIVLIVGGVVVGRFDRPRDGFPNTRQASRARAAYLSQTLPQLDAGVRAIQRDLQIARHICAG